VNSRSARRGTVITVLAAVTAVVVLAACGSQTNEVAAPAPATGVLKTLTGADVYQMSCARCHGVNREGKTDAPKLDSVRMSTLGEQPLRMTIRYGKGRMRGFGGLTDAQVDLLIAYLRS
jgi:mono/diheme cytochrome c family protein